MSNYRARTNSSNEQIEKEQKAWINIVDKILAPDAALVAISRYIGDSRIYVSGDRIAKIRSKRAATPVYHNSLRGEAEILLKLGHEVQYGEEGDWEFIIQPKIEGTPFSQHLFDQQSSAYGLIKKAKVLLGMVPELRRIHRLGISHGDLRPDNVFLRESGKIVLIDFDRATQTTPLRAVLRDWLGIGIGLTSANPYWKLALFTMFPKIHSLSQRLRFGLRGSSRVVNGETSSPDLQALFAAWKLAQISSANAPGQSLAYYALTYKGTHFIGERAWHLRWEAIQRYVDFSNKRVLELGCNMGLLSAYAALSGAKSATGIDHDATIVQSARLLADGLGADAEFQVVDLMGENDWEREYAGRDLVTALSVVHWLPEPKRVLSFLSEHSELLYEGHDTLEVEMARLKSLGFTQIDIVMETERDRHVLYARKAATIRD